MSKVLKTVVMRVTPEEAAKLRYQRKFDAAWAEEWAGQRERVRVALKVTGGSPWTVEGLAKAFKVAR